MTRPTKKTQLTAALNAFMAATKKPRFGVITCCPEGPGEVRVEIHPWKFTDADAKAVIAKLQEHFGLPAGDSAAPAPLPDDSGDSPQPTK